MSKACSAKYGLVMKGIVFTELLEMVESTFGETVASSVLDSLELPSGGAYTAVGTYDFAELQAIVASLAIATRLPPAALLHVYGKHLFGRFARLYPSFFDGARDSFDFLTRVDGFIHLEVKKLYPDAELPRFEHRRIDDRTLEMMYRSSRPLADFAAGLIEGCISYFDESIAVDRRNHPTAPADSAAVFTLTKR